LNVIVKAVSAKTVLSAAQSETVRYVFLVLIGILTPGVALSVNGHALVSVVVVAEFPHVTNPVAAA